MTCVPPARKSRPTHAGRDPFDDHSAHPALSPALSPLLALSPAPPDHVCVAESRAQLACEIAVDVKPEGAIVTDDEMDDEIPPAMRMAVIQVEIGAMVRALTRRLVWSPEAQHDLTMALLEYAAMSGLSDFVGHQPPSGERVQRFLDAARTQLTALLREELS